MVSGIDLLAHNQESLETELEQRIPDIAEVTHVYYVAYKAGMDVEKEMDEALEMFSKAVKAVDKLCPALEFIVLQIGTKICTSSPSNTFCGMNLRCQMAATFLPCSHGTMKLQNLALRHPLFPQLHTLSPHRAYRAHLLKCCSTTRK